MSFKKETIKTVEKIIESTILITSNILSMSREISRVNQETNKKIADLKQENSMLRDYLNVEIVSETVNGFTTTFIRKIK